MAGSPSANARAKHASCASSASSEIRAWSSTLLPLDDAGPGAAQLETVAVEVVEPDELVVRATADLTDHDASVDQRSPGDLEILIHDDDHVTVPVIVVPRAPLTGRELPQRDD